MRREFDLRGRQQEVTPEKLRQWKTINVKHDDDEENNDDGSVLKPINYWILCSLTVSRLNDKIIADIFVQLFVSHIF